MSGSKDSEISKVLQKFSLSGSSSSFRKSKKAKFPTIGRPLSPTRSNGRSKRSKTPGPANINSSPARESQGVKKPFVHKYIRVRSGTKTNEIPSWLENIFNKK